MCHGYGSVVHDFLVEAFLPLCNSFQHPLKIRDGDQIRVWGEKPPHNTFDAFS